MNQMYKALVAHFEAQKTEALALLALYMGNPQAVADHSNILEEMVKWTKKLSEAEESLECLKRNIIFNPSHNTSQENQ
jgi:hypothetical protein